MIFTGKVTGLAEGSTFIVRRYFDGRRDGYQHGWSQTGYRVTRRLTDSVEAETTVIGMGDASLPIFQVVGPDHSRLAPW
jgi:hypothetical protein